MYASTGKRLVSAFVHALAQVCTMSNIILALVNQRNKQTTRSNIVLCLFIRLFVFEFELQESVLTSVIEHSISGIIF